MSVIDELVRRSGGRLSEERARLLAYTVLFRGGPGSGFNPASLFAAGEQGVWYDPSDLTTLFQDTAGTTPVTAPGQTVALMLDKSGRGNHATQSNLAQRPTYGVVPATGRRNLLINTTTLATQSVTVAAGAHTLSFTGTGSVTLSGAATGTLTGTGVNDRVSLTVTATAGTLTLTVSGSVTLAQLETGSAVTAYQRVGTSAFDVTEQNVPTMHYLSFDGTDDGMLTGNIVPGIDKAQVFAGVRKVATTGLFQLLCEMAVNGETNDGAFTFFADNNAGQVVNALRGTQTSNQRYSLGFGASSVLTVNYDISQLTRDNEIIPRLNGTLPSLTGGGQLNAGTGNYLTYPLYIGRRGGTTLPFNGQLFSLIVRFGTNLPTATIQQAERYIGQRVAPTVTI